MGLYTAVLSFNNAIANHSHLYYYVFTFFMSDEYMFVCICNQVTDKQIRQAAEEGVTNLETLSAELKVGTCCGKCKSCARKILRQAVQENTCAQSYPVTGVPAFSPA